MKRLNSSDSLGALMAICPTTEEHSPRNSNHMYSREFQTMLEGLDEEGCVEESGYVGEKKRRLSVDQVKALEKNFEVENKLEPERKIKLAQELGLQPRQVAVWFQNRRARWKTKQLERDYGVLKANYDALKLNYDALQQDKEALLKEIRELKSNLNEENTESNISVKEEAVVVESEKNPIIADTIKMTTSNDANPHSIAALSDEASQENKNLNMNSDSFAHIEEDIKASITMFSEPKDGSSDSDSSAILNDDICNSGSPNNGAISSSSAILQNHNHQFMYMSNSNSNSNSSNSNTNGFPFHKAFHYVKVEEHNFFSGEEACNFYSEEQAPSLHWYSDQWN